MTQGRQVNTMFGMRNACGRFWSNALYFSAVDSNGCVPVVRFAADGTINPSRPGISSGCRSGRSALSLEIVSSLRFLHLQHVILSRDHLV